MFQFRKLTNTKASTRRHIQLKEVRDNILVLQNNTYCALLETSSVNFELKSDAEQDVLLETYQNFLNSLPYKLQILIRIRELDISAYLDDIATSNDKQKNTYAKELKQYQEFVKKLVSGNKILTRHFYIIIPYFGEKTTDFSLISEQLHLSVELVQRGLEKMGMKAIRLDSFTILNLFYSFYNSHQLKIQSLSASTLTSLQTYGNSL